MPQQAVEAAYTALESFSGTLDGSADSFALAHPGLMSGERQDLRIEGGLQHYALSYRLPSSQ